MTQGGPRARLSALRGFRADLAALGLGAATALALPPIHLLPLLAATLPGLLVLVDTAPSAIAAGRRGWWFGFGLNLVGLYWITEALLVEADKYWFLVPLAVPGVAAVLAIFVALTTWTARLAPPGGRRLAAFAGAWTLLDLARQFVATGFPWNPLGSVWELPGRAGDVMIQPAAWVGVHGLTLATVLVAGALVTMGWRGRVAGLVALAAWAGIGIARLSPALPAAPALSVILVQGNVPQGQKWDRALMVDIFNRYLRLTRDAVAATTGAAVVIWPETAVPFALEIDQTAREMIAEAAGQQPALVGGVRFGSADQRPRNSLFAILPGGITAAIYDKWHLVPFGEYQPDWIPLELRMGPSGFAAGPGPRTLHVPGLPPLGPLICYEAIFPAEGVDRQDRPAWLVNVTNDAWFGNSTGPRQHLAAARLRAVEEGLPVVRAANTGISAVFDPRGREVARLGMNETGFLTIQLPPALPATMFAQVGLYTPLVAGILALVAGFLTRRLTRM